MFSIFSQNYFNELFKNVFSELGVSQNESKNNDKKHKENEESNHFSSLTPAQLLVVVGLIGNVLNVNSVLVDKDQNVQVVLSGTLKQQTELEKTMNSIGKIPFDQVVKTIVDRL